MVENVGTAFIFIRDHVFVHELTEDPSISSAVTRLFGNLIWKDFVDLLLDKCIIPSMPISWDGLQKYRSMIEGVVGLEETMVNAGKGNYLRALFSMLPLFLTPPSPLDLYMCRIYRDRAEEIDIVRK
jgi:hypothetical protein